MRGFSFGLRDARAPATGNLVAHAGKPELDIHRANLQRAPIGRNFRRQTTRCRHNTVARIAQRIDHANRLGIGIRPVAVTHICGHIIHPLGALGLCMGGPIGGGHIVTHQRRQRFFRIPHNRARHMFRRIMATHIHTDNLRRMIKRRPRSGGEILQPCAHRQNHIGRFGNRIGTVRSGHPKWSDIQRMRVQHIGAPRNRLDHRYPRAFGKRSQLGDRTGILHTTARNNHRSLGRGQQRLGLCHLNLIRGLAAHPVHPLFKESGGIIIGPTLHILRQPDKRRPTIGWINHRGNRGRQRLDNLRGMRNAVPKPAHGFERIIGPQCRIAKMLELLQHRVGQAGHKRIPT